MIADAAAQKGTGKWAVSDAADIGVPVPTMAASVDGRLLSADRGLRQAASKQLAGPAAPAPGARRADLVNDVRAALYASKACAYAQGMGLLAAASKLHNWGLPLAELARIWKGGCIIRARFLARIQAAYARDPGLPNLLLDGGFREELSQRHGAWRRVVGEAVAMGVPLPAMSASLAYYDMLRTPRLPANLIQAQRDFFGAHTYERTDRPGSFHTEWTK
jgi:6-phosphogluconate dehydrogenase